MLSIRQKASILLRSGTTVPDLPAWPVPVQERPLLRSAAAAQEDMVVDAAQEAAVRLWRAEVEALYVEFMAARAARTLRAAEEARMLAELRHANAGVDGDGRAS